jgi:hypothetical protein
VDIWVAVLSSSVLSGAIGALVAGWFGLRSRRNEYENAYFKMVLDKRIASYTEVENLISGASNVSVDDKNRTYHAMFQPREHGLPEFYELLHKAMSGKFWLSDDLYAAMRKLNLIAYPAGDNQEALLAIAKDKYKDIAELRTTIERLHSRDMLTLHHVPEFLRSKRFGNDYDALPPRVG